MSEVLRMWSTAIDADKLIPPFVGDWNVLKNSR